MDILHLSDLHIIDKSTLDYHWNPASEALGARQFDYIVISGDLTQSAEPEEYRKVYSFLTDTLMKNHLKPDSAGNDRARIILVPGNHDICWDYAKGAFKKIAIDDATWKEAKKQSKNLTSDVRLVTEKNEERYSLQKISFSADYTRRFATFEDFYNSFYGDNTLVAPHKPMQLCSLKKGDDYSLHVFNEHDVIFVGLNSCHKNDCYSHVACFNPEVVNNIKREVAQLQKKHDKKYTLIGVWHHGLASGKGSHDYLDLSDLKELRRLGLHVGLHGHDHESSKKLIEELDVNILISGTGSLTAKGTQKPDGIRNEFSSIHIQDSYFTLTTYELKNSGYVPVKHAPNRLPLASNTPKGNQTLRPPIKAGTQRRTWYVDDEGIATVNIDLVDVSIEDNTQIPLAFWPSRKTNPNMNSTALLRDVDGINREVDVHKYLVGKNAIQAATANVSKGKYELLSWTYSVANLFALNQAELGLHSGRINQQQELRESVAHVIAFETLALTLSVELSTQSILQKNNEIDAIVIVEKPTIVCGEIIWNQVPAKEIASKPKIDIQPQGNITRLSLTAYKPVVGYRYSIAYKLALKGQELKESARKFRDDLTTHLRSRMHKNNDEELEKRFTSLLIDEFPAPTKAGEPQDLFSLRQAFHGTEIIGFFWCNNGNTTRSKLRTCFGNVPARKRDISFGYGEGLAGHAYRFNKIASWFNSDNDSEQSSSTVYAGRGPVTHEWIICVPVGPLEGPPMGVISFAHQQDAEKNEFARQMGEFAENVYRKHRNAISDSELAEIEQAINSFGLRLRTIVHSGFWSVLADTGKYGKGGFLDNAQRCEFARHQIPTPAKIPS